MLGEQTGADVGYLSMPIGVGCPGRVDRHVAFAVEAQRPVVEVGGSHPQHDVVDDRDLGMDINRCPRGGERVIKPEAAVHVALPEFGNQPGTGRIHRDRFEPAVRGRRIDDDDFRTIGLVESSGDCLRDPPGGEILAFGIDQPPRPRDERDIQRLDLVDRFLVGELWQRARDPDGHVPEVRLEPVRPAIRAIGHGLDRIPAGGMPPLPTGVTEGACHRALQRHGRVMPRPVRRAVRSDAARFLVLVVSRVPSFAGHVDAAAKGHAVVDHHDLLVMRSGDRMMPVEFEVDLAVAHPAQDREQGSAMEQRLERTGIPAQYVNIEQGTALDQPADERSDRRRTLVLPLPGELDPGVEVPADQHDAPLGLEHRGAGGPEIVIGVDDDGRTACRGGPPERAPNGGVAHGLWHLNAHDDAPTWLPAKRTRARAR